MKTKLILILILIHASFELAKSQQVDCIKLQSYVDSLMLDSAIIKKSFEAMQLFDNPYSRWEAGKVITKENDTLVGNILLAEPPIKNSLPIRVLLEDSSGKQKSYKADKIYKFNRGKIKYVSRKFGSYRCFAQEVFKAKVTIYYGKFPRTISAVSITPGVLIPYPLSAKDVFYFERDNKITGPIKANNLDSFIKRTCSCKIKYRKSDLHIYDIYQVLVYLSSQYE